MFGYTARMPKLTAKQQTTVGEVVQTIQRLGVAVPHKDTVAELLQSGSAWASRLAPALERVRQMLPDAALSLEPYTDPESGETLLVVYARFPEYSEASLQRMDEAQQAFAAAFQDTIDFPLLTTDFKPLNAPPSPAAGRLSNAHRPH
jgi:hypothetical protein